MVFSKNKQQFGVLVISKRGGNDIIMGLVRYPMG